MGSSSALLKHAPPAAGDEDGSGPLRAVLAQLATAGPSAQAPLLATAGALQIRWAPGPEAAETLLRAADLSVEAGHRNTGLSLCHRALRADPANPAIFARIADWSAQQGYRNDAASALHEFVSQLEPTGHTAPAVGALRNHLRYFPDDSAAQSRLAQLDPEDDDLPRLSARPLLQLAENSDATGAEPPLPLLQIVRNDSLVEQSRGDADSFAEMSQEPLPALLQVAPLEGLETTHPDEPWMEPASSGILTEYPMQEPPRIDDGESLLAPSDRVEDEPAFRCAGDSTHGHEASGLPVTALVDDLSSDPLDSPRGHPPETYAGPAAAEDGGGDSEASGAEDAAGYYDLAVAYKEMGLWNEAIKQLKLAVDAGARLLPVLELLGECYVEKGNCQRAIQILEHAARIAGGGGQDLTGVNYWLRRAREAAPMPVGGSAGAAQAVGGRGVR